jgi:hypothetical protein
VRPVAALLLQLQIASGRVRSVVRWFVGLRPLGYWERVCKTPGEDLCGCGRLLENAAGNKVSLKSNS